MPFKIGPWELIAILLIVLVVFGAGKLPQTGQAIGNAIREFRKASKPEGEDLKPRDSAAKMATPEKKKA